MLPAYHVTQQQLVDLSPRAWTNLVTMYDYNHAVFLQSDLDQFEAMKTKIGASLAAGDVAFAYDLHRVFVRRLDECVTFVTNLLEKTELDFSVDETCVFNRKDEPWPKTVEERNDLWRRRIKNEMLAQIVGRELDAEEDAEAERTGKQKKNRGKDKKIAKESEKTEPTPKENLLNKYRHYQT